MSEAGASAMASITESLVEVDASRLVNLIADAFSTAGLPRDAAIVAGQDLVDAELQGISSHGVMLVPMYVERMKKGSVSCSTAGQVVVDKEAVAVLDGGNVLGQLTSYQAIKIAREKARVHGLSGVAVRNGFHFGAAGRYASALAQEGFVGAVMCNTRPLMPAPGGAEPVVGNNPLAIAIPNGDDEPPILLDMATSATAMGRIRLAADRGEAIPNTWATDTAGIPTTNPADAIAAAMLLPAGGPKGFGLAMVIDLLCAGLSSGAASAEVRPLFDQLDKPYGCSHLFIAIDISHFVDANQFSEKVNEVVRRIRESKLAPGASQVMVPGEPGWRTKQENNGRCNIRRSVLAKLEDLAKSPTQAV